MATRIIIDFLSHSEMIGTEKDEVLKENEKLKCQLATLQQGSVRGCFVTCDHCFVLLLWFVVIRELFSGQCPLAPFKFLFGTNGTKLDRRSWGEKLKKLLALS